MTLLLYPGFHKTGTTLLQKRVLPKLGLDYLGRSYGTEALFKAEYRTAIEGHLAELARGETRVPELTRLFRELIQDESVHVLATENLFRPASMGPFLEALVGAAGVAPEGTLAVLVTVRRQFDLLVSRYLHDVNTKHPAIKGSTMAGRTLRKIWQGAPPYSLTEALDESNPPCRWPHCQSAAGHCPCSANHQVVGITLSFYDFSRVYEALKGSIPGDLLVFADLVDPALRPTGLERISRLLARYGVSRSPQEMEAHFQTPVNAQHGLEGGGFSRNDLDGGELSQLQRMTEAYYRAGNERLARAFPEFSAYLSPPADAS